MQMLSEPPRGTSIRYQHARLQWFFGAFAILSAATIFGLSIRLIEARHEIRRLTGEIPAATSVRP